MIQLKRAAALALLAVLATSPAHAKKPIEWSEFKANRVAEVAANRLMIPKVLPVVLDRARESYAEWQEAWSNHLRYKREAEAPAPTVEPSTLYATGEFAIPTYIVMCESGGNYLAENPVSTASGAYMFIDGTWNGFGGYYHASDAPPAVQDEKAALVWAGGAGASHWAACL